MVRKIERLLGALCVLVMLGFVGCRSDDDGGGGGAFLSEAALVGTWVSSDGDEFVFNADSTLGGECGDEEDCAATWSVQGNLLFIDYEYSESEEGCSISESERFGETAAIVSGVLYWGARLRTSGSGAGLNGTWTSSQEETGEFLEECEGERSSGEYEESMHDTWTIDGDTFERTQTMSEMSVEGGYREEYNGSLHQRGTIRVDGDIVFYTATEEDGDSIPPDSQYEDIFGLLVAPGVVYQLYEEQDPEDVGLRRR